MPTISWVLIVIMLLAYAFFIWTGVKTIKKERGEEKNREIMLETMKNIKTFEEWLIWVEHINNEPKYQYVYIYQALTQQVVKLLADVKEQRRKFLAK